MKSILKKPQQAPQIPPAAIDVNMRVQNKQPHSKVGNGKAIGSEINKLKNQSAKDKLDRNAQNPIRDVVQTKQEPVSPVHEKPVMWQQNGMPYYPQQQCSPTEYQNHTMMYGQQTQYYPPQQMIIHPGQQQMAHPPMPLQNEAKAAQKK